MYLMPLNPAYIAPVERLIALLSNHVSYSMNRSKDGYILFFEDGSDVAIHFSSLGSDEGLFESMNMPQDCDDTTGYLTAEDVIERLKANALYEN